MNKLFFLITIITFHYFSFSQHKSIEVHYKKSIDFTDKIYSNPEYKNLIPEIRDAISNLNYLLKINDNESIFMLQESMESDLKVNTLVKRIIYSAYGKSTFYTNLNDSIIKELKSIDGQDYLIKNEKQKFKLSNETKKIKGYTCYKATWTETIEFSKLGKKELKDKENKYIVWYAPEISKSFGPINAFGLPGLILELQFNNIKYYATKLDFKSKVKIKNIKGIEITNHEYNDMLIKMLKDKFN
jgi:GLPGLI family protein